MDIDNDEDDSEVEKRHFEEAMKLQDDQFQIKISKNTRCLHRHYNKAEGLDRISDSLKEVRVVVVLQLEEVQEQILKIIMTMMTFIANFRTKQSLYLIHFRFHTNNDFFFNLHCNFTLLLC